jgi:hypothetical protein
VKLRNVGKFIMFVAMVSGAACSKDRSTGSSFNAHSSSACPAGIEGSWESTDASGNRVQVKFERQGEALLISYGNIVSKRVDGTTSQNNDGSSFVGFCEAGKVHTTTKDRQGHEVTEFGVENGQLVVTQKKGRDVETGKGVSKLSLQKI